MMLGAIFAMLGAKGCHSTIPQGSSKTDVLAVFCCGQSLTKQTAKKRLKAVLRVLEKGEVLTADLGGSATTEELTAEIIKNL